MLKELYGSHEQMKDNKSETTDDIKFIKVYDYQIPFKKKKGHAYYSILYRPMVWCVKK